MNPTSVEITQVENKPNNNQYEKLSKINNNSQQPNQYENVSKTGNEKKQKQYENVPIDSNNNNEQQYSNLPNQNSNVGNNYENVPTSKETDSQYENPSKAIQQQQTNGYENVGLKANHQYDNVVQK